MKNQRDLFLSHASEDNERFVFPLAAELDKSGISYWLAEAEIKIGDKFINKINEGIRISKYVLVFISDAYMEKNWPETELLSALGEENETGQTVVLPVLISDPKKVFHHYPILRGKVFARWSEGIPKIIRQLNSRLDRIHGGIFVDLSHNQRSWRGDLGGFQRFVRKRPEILPIEDSILQHKYEIQNAAAMVLALPRKCKFSNDEMTYIEEWVSDGGGLFLLGYYLADSHNHCNLNSLAQMFDFEFGENLIMPIHRSSRADCFAQWTMEKDSDLSLIIQIEDDRAHAIVQNVKEVAILSACSIKNIVQEPEFVLESPLSAVMNAVGHKESGGYMERIENWLVDCEKKVPILAAWRHGLGKVVASGTWKLCTQIYGNNSDLVTNILKWVSRSQ